MVTAQSPAPVYLEDLGIDTSNLDESAGQEQSDPNEESALSFDSDISALNTPTERPATGESTPAAASTTEGGSPPAEPEPVEFEQPAPAADWQQRAEANQWKVGSEAEFNDQLQLTQYIQSNFFSDPSLALAHKLLQPVAEHELPLNQKALIEYDIRQKAAQEEEVLHEQDIEEAMAKYVDEEGNINERGQQKAAFIQQKLNGMIDKKVNALAQEGRQHVALTNEYNSSLQEVIRALPSDLYTPAEKRELHKYILSDQYKKDAILEDGGKQTVQGAARAAKVVENAQYLNPAYRQKILKSQYEDARKMGADDFVKKYFKQQ